MRQTIKNAMLPNGEKINIVIKDGKINKLSSEADEEEGEMLHLPDNVYVSPGWIDLHTHSFPKFEPYCAHPDDIGYTTGVTTVVDAGSCGAQDIGEFHELIQNCRTRVYSFLNISKVGLRIRNELADLAHISERDIKHALDQYPHFIVGLKARMSASVIGDNGIQPLKLAKEFSHNFTQPLMVHIGSAPPKIQEVLSYLEHGDIITHCYNEKENNHIFSNEAVVQPALRAAMERGVYLDVGHGTSSFSFEIAKQAFEAAIEFDSISTDIYDKNKWHGPVYDMATTLTKFLMLGYPLEKVIKAVTEVPATIIHKPELGSLAEGTPADLTFFKVETTETIVEDSLGRELTAQQKIIPIAVMIGGTYYECTKVEHQARH